MGAIEVSQLEPIPKERVPTQLLFTNSLCFRHIFPVQLDIFPVLLSEFETISYAKLA